MNKYNSFFHDLDTLKEIYLKIRKEISNKLESLRNSNAVDNTNGKIEALLIRAKENFMKIEDDLDLQAEDNTIPIIEIEKRKELIKEIKETFEKLKESYDYNIKSLKPGLIENDRSYENLRKDDRGLIVQIQLKKQDDIVDQFSGMTKNIKKVNQEINDELIKQQNLITKLNYGVDKTNNQIVETQSKLDTYLQKSSSCCLYSFIALEILIVVLLLIS